MIDIAQGSHGFMKTNKWRDTIGAFINIEASGSDGPGMKQLIEMCALLFFFHYESEKRQVKQIWIKKIVSL